MPSPRYTFHKVVSTRERAVAFVTITTSGYSEIALAVRIFASLPLAFLDERAIEALLGLALKRPQAGQRLVEIAPLLLELADALGDPLEPASVLRRAGGIRLIEIQVLADGVDGKSQPPQSLDENEAGPVLIVEDAGAAHARRRDQPALLVETDALRRERKLGGELGYAIEPGTVGRR